MMRDKNLPVLFLNLLRSKVKWQLFCRRFVRKFHNALIYVVCLAFHCWCHVVSRFTVAYSVINGTVISAREREREKGNYS